MYVGVILSVPSFVDPQMRIPHVCGGDPVLSVANVGELRVFPMYVGVILPINRKSQNKKGIPHVCGGDPLAGS